MLLREVITIKECHLIQRVLDRIVTISFGVYLVLCLLELVCNVWVCVCVGVCMSVCFGNMCTCIYCVLYCLYCVFVLFSLCIFILICFVCTNVRTTATEWKLNRNNNNNNNNNYYYYILMKALPEHCSTIRTLSSVCKCPVRSVRVLLGSVTL